MSEQKKYVTFKDLRTVSPKSDNPLTSTSTSSSPSSTSTSSQTSISSITSTPKETKIPKAEVLPPIAPERDFQRIPNSVTRRAIPEGLFRGKSKQVWDYLWSVSRGAVIPLRAVRKSRREIKAGSGLGSMVTVDAALEHLEGIGLLAIRAAIGSLIGNEYEVFTPEEASTRTTSITSIARATSLTQKVDELDVPESSNTSTTQPVENRTSYSPPNTSFNTKEIKIDDEAFARFLEAVRKANKELTGKEPYPSESEKWGELAEVLITELKIASGRTTISSVPAFLAEHLRRRLWKKEKRQIEIEAAEQRSIQAPKVDTSKCPDCSGTGMYYPEGYEKGVARCGHGKLTESKSGDAAQGVADG